MSFWCISGMWQYIAHLSPFMELKVVLSWTGQFPSWAEPCCYMTFLCGHLHVIAIVQAVLQSDLCIGLCCHSLPCKIGLICTCLIVCALLSWGHLELESHTEPMPVQRLQNTPTITMQTNGRMPSGTMKTLEGWELLGGLQSISSDAHLLGVTSLLFGL